MSQDRKILKNCVITGFADEIDVSVDKQLALLKQLGISYVEFRSGDGINVADYTTEQAKALKEKLDANGIKVSALGSPIGKIGIEDAFAPHLEKLSHVMDIAEILETKYIRMFSFFMPDEQKSGKKPEDFREDLQFHQTNNLGRFVWFSRHILKLSTCFCRRKPFPHLSKSSRPFHLRKLLYVF